MSDLPCECCTPDGFGDYDPCCNEIMGFCETDVTIGDIGLCKHCGGEMVNVGDIWYHHSQIEVTGEKK